MFSETAYSSQTKLIGLNLHVSEHGIGYSNLTPGVKIQVLPNQKTWLTKVVRHDIGMIKISSAPPEELGAVHKLCYAIEVGGWSAKYNYCKFIEVFI